MTTKIYAKAAIHKSALIDPEADIDPSVTIEPYVIIGKNVKIGKGTTIGAYSHIECAEIGNDCEISYYVCIGAPPQDLKYSGAPTKVVIGNNCVIREYSTIHRASKTEITRVGNNCFLMSYIHIGHDSVIGNHVVMANCASLGGHTHIEDYANLGALVGIHQFSRIGTMAMLAGGAMVTQDIPPYTTAAGDRARLYGLNLVGLKRRNFPSETIKGLKKAYQTLFASHLSHEKALAAIEASSSHAIPEVKHFTEFIKNTQRGICHSV